MQTFLPYPDFEETARCLDDRRLGKQRVEAYTILRVLRGQTNGNGWKRHPAVLMWRGYEPALASYMDACIDEWVRRGFVNNMVRESVHGEPDLPPWLGDERFHASHRSNLLRKQPDHYRKYWPDEPDHLPYYWP